MAKAARRTVLCEFVQWDWSDEPDVKSIEGSVNLLLSKGATRVYFAEADDGTDSYSFVVSDSHLSNADASSALEDRNDAIASGNPPPASGPFVWHRR